MRAVVRDAFIRFTEPLEGGVACCYADIRGKVTVAYGNLVDSPGEVAALPLVRADGSLASIAEKIALWNVLHDDPNAANGGWRYASRLSPLRLPREAMTGLALSRLDVNDRILAAKYPNWEDLPACAQLALHSLAWACGANAHYPRLTNDVLAGDYEAAAIEIYINEWTPEGKHNSGLVPRNMANKILMRNAGRVVAFHLDPDLLDWAHDLSVADETTQPSLSNPASEPTVIVSAEHRDFSAADDLGTDPDDAA